MLVIIITINLQRVCKDAAKRLDAGMIRTCASEENRWPEVLREYF